MEFDLTNPFHATFLFQGHDYKCKHNFLSHKKAKEKPKQRQTNKANQTIVELDVPRIWRS